MGKKKDKKNIAEQEQLGADALYALVSGNQAQYDELISDNPDKKAMDRMFSDIITASLSGDMNYDFSIEELHDHIVSDDNGMHDISFLSDDKTEVGIRFSVSNGILNICDHRRSIPIDLLILPQDERDCKMGKEEMVSTAVCIMFESLHNLYPTLVIGEESYNELSNYRTENGTIIKVSKTNHSAVQYAVYIISGDNVKLFSDVVEWAIEKGCYVSLLKTICTVLPTTGISFADSSMCYEDIDRLYELYEYPDFIWSDIKNTLTMTASGESNISLTPFFYTKNYGFLKGSNHNQFDTINEDDLDEVDEDEIAELLDEVAELEMEMEDISYSAMTVIDDIIDDEDDDVLSTDDIKRIENSDDFIVERRK